MLLPKTIPAINLLYLKKKCLTIGWLNITGWVGMARSHNARLINVFTLAMINTAAIVNLNNLPSMVVLGYGLISYLMLAAIFFFLPTAFVSAELATGWPQSGGFYSWVRIAYGPIIGFLAIWLQWVANIIWYPTLILPIVNNGLTVFAPSVAHDKWLIFITMIVVFWILTLINMRGIRDSSLISTIGVLLGSILPAILLMVFAVVWLLKGLPVDLHFKASALIPEFTHLSDMSILISVIVTLVGMEMSAVHVNNVKNPRTAYPRAALISAVVILSTFMLTSLAMAVLIPPNKIDLINGVIQCLQNFSLAIGLPWLVPLLMVLIIIGILTMASTWILGPSRGLQVAAGNGEFPDFFSYKNKHESPSRILCLQAIIYTVISTLVIFIPSIASSYWILIAVTGQLYMLMYIILFCTGIRLRYLFPQVVREYTIPGPWHLGMWFMVILGFIGTIMTFIITFFPPAQFSNLEGQFYVKFLLLSFTAICLVPLVLFTIYAYFKRRRIIEALPFDQEDTDLVVADMPRLPMIIDDNTEDKHTSHEKL